MLDGKTYGVKYEMNAATISIVGVDGESGNQVMALTPEKGYEDPEVTLENSLSKGCVTVRVQDRNKFEVWQVDATGKGRLVRKLDLVGYGRLGGYGDASLGGQGPYQCVWTYEKRKLARPQ